MALIRVCKTNGCDRATSTVNRLTGSEDRHADPGFGSGWHAGLFSAKTPSFSQPLKGFFFYFFSISFKFFFDFLQLEREALPLSLKTISGEPLCRHRRRRSPPSAGELWAIKMAPNNRSGPSGFRSTVLFA